MKKRNRKNSRFKNPHYSSRKHLPRGRSSSKSFIAKYFSTRDGGIAFRIADGDFIKRTVDDAVKTPENCFDSCVLSDPEVENVRLDERVRFYIDNRHTGTAINGDIVRVRPLHHNDVEVVEILSRAHVDVIGIVYEAEDESGQTVWVLEPDDKKLDFSVIITDLATEVQPKDGDKAVARITEYPERGYSDAEGTLIRVYGDALGKSANYQAILEANAVITEFSEDALAQAQERSFLPITADGRVDLRDSIIFTLDGADAKDLDDAITVRTQGENYILGVHIADVSHYVQPKTQLDREAMARGTSIYFADRVVPMLPEALSNGSCSLNSGVDRYALSAEMTVNKNGDILSTNIFKSVIRSKLRGVYSEFNLLLSRAASDEIIAKYAVIPEEMLENALALFSILKRKSERRGVLELDSDEAAILLDGQGEPVDIMRRERGMGELMIEQFMLCANEGVASWLKERELPCVYRIHEQPDPEKLSAFTVFAHNLGLQPEYLRRGASVTPGYFKRILNRARERGIGTPVSYMLLRTMMKARYSEVCSGHFGLGTSCYCHFTSPIRRYPDLSVHRIISYALKKGEPQAVCAKYSGFAALSARTSSDCELRALKVEREMDELFKALYLSKRVGEEYPANISSVTAFGMFCRLENTCEGLVPISSLDGYFRFNENTLSLSCDERVYKIGDSVRIRVENVDIPTGKVDFILV
ncbi:MAG: ribonuclease R [Clostridia bacterium]|nr:ribonuclease R [Clostridia bacterium]